MISIGINLILGVLLVCALMLGLRLERRLRALKQSHLDFAKAVSELDQAALRTEQGLAQLQAGSEAARVEIGSRIDQARLACQRLEQLTAAADKAALQPIPRQALAAVPGAQPATTAPVVHAFEAPQRTEPTVRAMQPAARSKVRVDDDLFDTSAPRETRMTAGARW